ncbi:MAG: hypothetical protein ACOY0R_04680 [Chloroflexota bacterium]
MTQTRKNAPTGLVFDHIAIRRFIGLIAILLPLIVDVAAWDFLPSISASYHADPSEFPFLPYFPSPRNIFVGALFVIGAFLMSYKGHQVKLAPEKAEAFWHKLGKAAVAFRCWEHEHEEDIVSWIGGIAAWGVALFPTGIPVECVDSIAFSLEMEPAQPSTVIPIVHLFFAAVLFLTTSYFSLVAFKRRVDQKTRQRGPAGAWYADRLQHRRSIYTLSGWTTLALIAVLGLLALFYPEESGKCLIYNQTFWAETVMLELFGAAWFTASKPGFLRDPGESG